MIFAYEGAICRLRPQIKPALHVLVLLHLLRLLERSMRWRHLHCYTMQRLLDGENYAYRQGQENRFEKVRFYRPWASLTLACDAVQGEIS